MFERDEKLTLEIHLEYTSATGAQDFPMCCVATRISSDSPRTKARTTIAK
jgi:hypothetical protein